MGRKSIFLAYYTLLRIFHVFWAGIPQMTPENFQLWQGVKYIGGHLLAAKFDDNRSKVAPTERQTKKTTKVITC